MPEIMEIEADENQNNLNSLRISSLEEDGEEGSNEEIEEDEEDDDEVDNLVPVTLGFVEKPKYRCSLLRHLFPSKAGGVPAWLEPVDLPSERSCVCDICREPLQFLLQLHFVVGVGHGKEKRFAVVAEECAIAQINTRFCIGDQDIMLIVDGYNIF